MKISIACGGTGGHIFPGVATADELRRRGHEVKLWLAGKDVEAPALKDWKGPVVTVPAEGLPSGFSLRALRAAWKLGRAALVCRRLLRQDRPDVLLAMGSYASAGPVAAALSLGVPVVLHEANVIPGRAIALFSRWATAVAGCFEETRYHLRGKELHLTGMPIRGALEKAASGAPPRAIHDPFTVLVMGGSRGAHRLNDIASAALAQVHASGGRLRVIHLSGVPDEAAVRSVYQAAGVPHRVEGFSGDMAPAYLAADLAICRAGGATCAELTVFALPALLVPFPFATNDHQTANAHSLEKIGAADVVPEKDLGVPWLADYVARCMADPGRLAKMSAAFKSRNPRRPAEALADLVVSVGGGFRGVAARA